MNSGNAGCKFLLFSQVEFGRYQLPGSVIPESDTAIPQNEGFVNASGAMRLYIRYDPSDSFLQQEKEA